MKIVIFSNDDKNSYLFSSFVFPIKNSIPNILLPKTFKISLLLPRTTPLPPPPHLPQYNTLEIFQCSFSCYSIFVWLWVFFCLFYLLCLQGTAPFRTNLCMTEICSFRIIAFTDLMI